MALSFCNAPETGLPGGMEHEVWQVRARRAGLTQRVLARLTGRSEVAVSQQLRGKWESGVPLYVKTIIRAWEMLSAEQREKLRGAAEDDDDRA